MFICKFFKLNNSRPKPILLNRLKKEMKTVTIATIPNSSGVSNLASIAPIKMLIKTLLYLDKAIKIFNYANLFCTS